MTEFLVTRDVDYIPPHVFEFTDLSALIDAAGEDKYLIGECFCFVKDSHTAIKQTCY